MTDGRIPKSMIQDPVGRKYWPFHKGRDPFRTPMQWKPTPGAGFTKGTPWLPVNSDFGERNVAAQEKSRNSLLSVYRELIALRRKHESLRRGEFVPFLEGEQNVLGFYRTTPTETCAVLLNFSSLSRSLSAGDSQLWEVIYSLHGKKETLKGLNVVLAPGDVLVARRLEGNA
jgi:alpha-glucosidase